MSISFSDGAYNRASGTRGAFGALSDDLVAEGYPAMVSISGDREPEEQLRIWYERMTLAPGNRRVYGTRWWQGKTWYQIHPNTVGIPDTSNHEKRRSNDLRAPYNADTAAARRAKKLAKKRNITREGEGFRELWHWTFWGDLGIIDNSAAGSGSSTEEDTMKTVNINGNIYGVDKQFLSHFGNQTQAQVAQDVLTGPELKLGSGAPALARWVGILDAAGIPQNVLDAQGRVLDPQSGKYAWNNVWSREREILAALAKKA